MANLRGGPFSGLFFCFLFVQTGPNLCRLQGSIVQFISLSPGNVVLTIEEKEANCSISLEKPTTL